LPGSESTGPVALRVLADDAQDFGFRGRQFDVITDAEEHGFRRPTLLNHEGAALTIHAVEQLPEIRTRAQRGNYDAAGLVGR
jgi:hypothetical protein